MIPAAMRTILLLYPQIDMPTSKANTRVKAINRGRAYFLNCSTQQAMKHERAIRTTDKMIIIGMFTNIFLNNSLLKAQ